MGQGFQHQYGHYGWGIDYTNYTIPHNAPARFAVYDWHRNGQPLYEQGYATDLFANEASGAASQPLADRMRPERLEEFFGQEHILGDADEGEHGQSPLIPELPRTAPASSTTPRHTCATLRRGLTDRQRAI